MSISIILLAFIIVELEKLILCCAYSPFVFSTLFIGIELDGKEPLRENPLGLILIYTPASGGTGFVTSLSINPFA